ncbi:MAG: NRDE family protein [Reichenbachiella sp.]|uniref:NRDE family protein n=1 Tax=Reichenbachiella sp. TaxID=2184521 RepID=UPI003266DD97
MCLILFSWKSHPDYDLILTANRDEFYNRPALPAHRWPEHLELIAGKDLTGGGTWMGITAQGRMAALTNYRDPENINPTAPSRGALTKDFLTSQVSPESYLEALRSEKKAYNGFNLLVGDNKSLWYYNNINHEVSELAPGVYGLSNALLNNSWPKVDEGRKAIHQLQSMSELSTQELLNVVQNKALAPDKTLPATGVPLEWERALSAMHITMDGYGTRCSTAILKSQEKIHFSEWTHPLVGQKEDQVDFIL